MLSYSQVKARVAGRIARKTVAPGNYVEPGADLMAVVPREVYVTANFKETQLTQLRPGQPVKIEVDPYPDLIALYKALGADGNNRRLRLLPAIWVRSPRWQLTVDLKNVYCRDPARKFFTDGIGVDPLPRATIPALMTFKIRLD